MSRGIFALQLIGRLGNCLFQYAHARSFCEKYDLELQVIPWIGHQVFGLTEATFSPESVKDFPQKDENTLNPEDCNIRFSSYCQQQKCLTYTRSDCKKWFQFSPAIIDAMKDVTIPEAIAHRRMGDYEGY